MRGKTLRVRRLTLPPATCLEVPPSEDGSADPEQDRILAREHLARELEVALSFPARHSPTVHGVEDRLGYRFWARDEDDEDSVTDLDSDSEVDEVISIDSPEFVNIATKAGYSISDLVQAEAEIEVSPTTQRLFVQPGSKGDRIIRDLVKSKSSSTPWQGPLLRQGSHPSG